jgi:beta-lactamase regulating signal transducer with metallopeptidase domain
MNRTLLILSAVFGASNLLIVDAAVKGTALLVLATALAAALRRDSAATRHLVWLLTMVALLVVPAISAFLPQWRVLPAWASIPTAPPVALPDPLLGIAPAIDAVPMTHPAQPDGVGSPAGPANQSSATMADAPPVPAATAPLPAPAASSWEFPNVVPLVWAVGCCMLIVRLLAARWILWNTERNATVMRWSLETAQENHEPIMNALEAVRRQLGIRRPVTLLMHPDRAIPIVWGIFRLRLLLPAAARQWSDEQLRSVLLHELAHVKRRDTLTQLLTQVVCALYWFNPLVWWAAWRLGVERERACDDLVLASGVRPSAYAGHLLQVVTDLSPVRWMHSCGLAMARQSSLEGRLIAVLSTRPNRRGVSATLAAIGLAIAVAIAVPIAMLQAVDAGPGVPAPQPEAQKPKSGVKLSVATEARLRWGEPVNGLRAALATRLAANGSRDLYLVVQNVSEAALRFTDTAITPERRALDFRREGVLRGRQVFNSPTMADVVLQPREVAFLELFPHFSKKTDTDGADFLLTDDVLKEPRDTLSIHMHIANAPAGAWTGKLVTGEATGESMVTDSQPKSTQGQALFKTWQANARTNGDIPGGLVDRLGAKVREFIRNNTGDPWGNASAKKMTALVPRFDAARAAPRDWKPAEIVALFDDVATVSTIPLETTMSEGALRTITTGVPLPKHLANAPWGEAQPSGLRVAWLLEPRAVEYPLNTPLKSRILLHNSGKEAVVFRANSFRQSAYHKAHDATGADLPIDSTDWTTLGRLMTFRLAPGEFVEVVLAAGIGVGAEKHRDDWRNTRVGAWIDAKVGDDVTFQPDAVPLYDDDRGPPGANPGWWHEFIAARLACELPLPAAADERTHLLTRVMRDLLGNAPTAEETAAFVADRQPNALETLAKRLAQRAGQTAASGSLTSGVTRFRVLPADPDADKRPRVVHDPGWYNVSDLVRLDVTRRPHGERVVNEATMVFFAADSKKPAPGKPYVLKLPDGYNTWAAAWLRGQSVLWVHQQNKLRSYDFTNPAEVKETPIDQPADLERVPMAIREALRAALDAPGNAGRAPEAPKQKSP